MHVSNDQLKSMLGTIGDPRLKREISDIISGQVTKEIHCLSKKCKGRVIGRVYNNGNITMVTDKDGKNYLRSSRQRFDKFMGFECWCGNDSRLAAQEKGHIGEAAPSRKDLEAIWQNIMNKPGDYPIKDGEQIIDGFMIKEII